MTSFTPTAYRIDINSDARLMRIVGLDESGKDSVVLEMSLEAGAHLIIQILTAVANTFQDQPFPPDGTPVIKPAGLPWVAPLRMALTRGDASAPPGLIFEFGGMTMYFALDVQTISHVLRRFVDKNKP